MPEHDWLIAMVMGGVFVLLGLGAIYLGKGEEKSYYNTISTRADAREFIEHAPHRPEPHGLKIGGWIAISVGLLMIALGGLVLR